MEVIKGLKKTGPSTSLMVYRIRHHNLFFRWCYIDVERANTVAIKLSTEEKQFHPVNWTRDPEQCSLSQVERAKITRVAS